MVLCTKYIYLRIFIVSKQLRCKYQVDFSTHHHQNFRTHILCNSPHMYYISKAWGLDFYPSHTMYKLVKISPIFPNRDLLHLVMPDQFHLGSFNSKIFLFDMSVLILFLLISVTFDFKVLESL